MKDLQIGCTGFTNRLYRSFLFVSRCEVSAIIEKNLLKTVLIKSPSAITHGNCSSALERPPRGVFEGRISF